MVDRDVAGEQRAAASTAVVEDASRGSRVSPERGRRLSPDPVRSSSRFKSRPVAAVEARPVRHPARRAHPQERAGAPWAVLR